MGGLGLPRSSWRHAGGPKEKIKRPYRSGRGWVRLGSGRPPGMCTQTISGKFQAAVLESGGDWGQWKGEPEQGHGGEPAAPPLDGFRLSLCRNGKQGPSGSSAFIFPQFLYGLTPGKLIVNGAVT